MPAFVEGPVTVSVPATSANLGPGFDCLGLALDLRDRLVAEVTGAGLEVEVEGEGADQVPRDEDHLVVRAIRAAFEQMDVAAPGLRLRCHNVIPHSRGLGSSSAAIVGGIVLARALVREGAVLLDDDAALALATGIEGHPDNVAPALLGGFVVCGQDDAGVWALPCPVDPALSAVVFVPATGVSTAVARSLLPDTISHRDAVANTGRAALLVAALAGAPQLLLRATEDFVHQRYREPAMPDSLGLVRRLRDEGVAAVVSGAGPTVLAFDPGQDAGRDALEDSVPEGWQARRLRLDAEGARIE
ncbi:MAG TPA: homoserine kinase [Marmoricola sp.]|nr:homoserine kinase [Marmoricola sp.]